MGKIESATEYYALGFDDGFAEKLFDSINVEGKIRKARWAVSIDVMTKKQFLAFLVECEKGYKGWDFRNGKYTICFISKKSIPTNSVAELSLKLLLNKGIAKRDRRRTEKLLIEIIKIASYVRDMDDSAKSTTAKKEPAITVKPIESATADSPRMIQVARVKKKKETADKTTFTKEEYKEFLENSPIVNAPDNVAIEEINRTVQDSLRDAFIEGWLTIETLADMQRDRRKHALLEEMLLDRGMIPAQVGKYLKPNADSQTLKNETERIRIAASRRKEKT